MEGIFSFSNSYGTEFSQIVCEEDTRDYPERWRNFTSSLQNACRLGDIERVNELQQELLWNDLEEGYLAYVLDLLLLTQHENANQEGKRAIFFILTSHPQWRPTDLENLLLPLIKPRGLSFEKGESDLLISAFLKIPRLEEITVGLLTEVTKIVLHHEEKEFFHTLIALPAWNQIPPYAYTKILFKAFSLLKNDFEMLDILLAHPCWNRLSTRDLCYLADPSNGGVLLILSKNEKWKDLSTQELCHLGYHPFISSEAVDLITTHPRWKEINRQELADLASSVGNKYSDHSYELFLKITEHPQWEELTKEDLDEIVEWLYPEGNHRKSVLNLILNHKSWTPS